MIPASRAQTVDEGSFEVTLEGRAHRRGGAGASAAGAFAWFSAMPTATAKAAARTTPGRKAVSPCGESIGPVRAAPSPADPMRARTTLPA